MRTGRRHLVTIMNEEVGVDRRSSPKTHLAADDVSDALDMDHLALAMELHECSVDRSRRAARKIISRLQLNALREVGGRRKCACLLYRAQITICLAEQRGFSAQVLPAEKRPAVDGH